MEYNFRETEKFWQNEWQQNLAYNVSNDSSKPKYYVLDMFPIQAAQACTWAIRWGI